MAAKMLTDAVRDYLRREVDLSVYLFYNEKGLAGTLQSSRMKEAHDGLDDFVIGFNQSCRRFLMVDVGYGKEEADVKLKSVSQYSFLKGRARMTMDFSQPISKITSICRRL